MLAGDGPTLKLTRKIHTLGLFIEITTQQIINLKPNLPPRRLVIHFSSLGFFICVFPRELLSVHMMWVRAQLKVAGAADANINCKLWEPDTCSWSFFGEVEFFLFAAAKEAAFSAQMSRRRCHHQKHFWHIYMPKISIIIIRGPWVIAPVSAFVVICIFRSQRQTRVEKSQHLSQIRGFHLLICIKTSEP